MLLELFIAIFLGILAGIITGLTPGIHINLVAILALTSAPLLLIYTSPLILSIFIISMAISHTFLNAIPAIYLGAPDAETALSILPGHQLLNEGRGYEAVKLTVIGSLIGLILTILISPLLIISVANLYKIISPYIVYILILSMLFLIIKEKTQKTWTLTCFLLSGVLGIIVLTMNNLPQPLFPLLSGLFGTSQLLISLKDKVKIPTQNFLSEKISKKEITKSVSAGFFASTICGFFPGLGAAQAAIIASSGFKKISKRSFLILVGAIDTIVMAISFVALYTIEKARNGAVVTISELIPNFSLNHLIIFLASSLIVAALATILSLKIAKLFSKLITKISYPKICITIISLITILVTFISGPIGLLILITATLVGMIPSLVGIGRNHLMGCLILPVILYFIL